MRLFSSKETLSSFSRSVGSLRSRFAWFSAATAISLTSLSPVSGCTSPSGDEPLDPENECALCAGKEDAHGVRRGSYEALGILAVVNSASFDELDLLARLNARAARNIVDWRTGNGPYTSIEQLDTVFFVGAATFAALLRYAEEQGLVPSCGDGTVQPTLEECDDGNTSPGDACPADCRDESTLGLVRGATLGSALAVDGADYLPSRNISQLMALGVTPQIVDFVRRADGIGANFPSNDSLEISELDVLTTEPFLSSLFPEERDAAMFLWDVMQVSDAAPEDLTAPPSEPEIFAENASVRPGQVEIPLIAIDSIVRNAQIRDAAMAQAVARRLQNLPDVNVDTNADTVAYTDVQAGLDRFAPVFTQAEVQALEQLQAEFHARVRFSETPIARTHVPAPYDRRQVEFDRVEEVRFVIDEELKVTAIFQRRHLSMQAGVESFYRAALTTVDGSRAALLAIEPVAARGRVADGEELETVQSAEPSVRLVERWVDGQRVFNQLVRLPVISRESNRTLSLDHTYRHELTLRDGTLLFPTYASRASSSTTVNWRLDVEPDDVMDLTQMASSQPADEHLAVGRYEVAGVSLYVYPSGTVEVVTSDTDSGRFGTPESVDYVFQQGRYRPGRAGSGQLFWQNRWHSLRSAQRDVSDPVIIER